MAKRLPRLLKGAQPQFYRGNNIGCLVVHGYMASPAEVGWMGLHLAQEKGYTVYVPRLTGHGYNPKHMRRMRWQDWYGQVLDAYYLMRQQCDQIYYVGHSMGALLGILLASEHELDGLVITAAPIINPSSLIRWTKWIQFFRTYTFHPTEEDLSEEILKAQIVLGEEETGRVNYEKWATRAAHELYKLITMGYEYLPNVTCPVQTVYAKGDVNAAPPDNADLIKQRIKSKVLEQVVLDKGAHIIFQDVGRHEAFDVISDFIARHVEESTK